MSSVVCYQLQRVGHYILPPRRIIILINLLLERSLIQLPVDHCLVYPDRKNWGGGGRERGEGGGGEEREEKGGREKGERRERGGREEGGRKRENTKYKTKSIHLNPLVLKK